MKHFGIIFLLLLVSLAAAQNPYKLRVTSWTCAKNGAGELVATGRVFNQSGKTLRNIRINLQARDNANALRGTNSAYIALRSLANGTVSSFSVKVKPTSALATKCNIWFRNPDVVQIPTLVPAPK